MNGTNCEGDKLCSYVNLRIRNPGLSLNRLKFLEILLSSCSESG